jgi:hypothetical protein
MSTYHTVSQPAADHLCKSPLAGEPHQSLYKIARKRALTQRWVFKGLRKPSQQARVNQFSPQRREENNQAEHRVSKGKLRRFMNAL